MLMSCLRLSPPSMHHQLSEILLPGEHTCIHQFHAKLPVAPVRNDACFLIPLGASPLLKALQLMLVMLPEMTIPLLGKYVAHMSLPCCNNSSQQTVAELTVFNVRHLLCRLVALLAALMLQLVKFTPVLFCTFFRSGQKNMRLPRSCTRLQQSMAILPPMAFRHLLGCAEASAVIVHSKPFKFFFKLRIVMFCYPLCNAHTFLGFCQPHIFWSLLALRQTPLPNLCTMN
mmetsp:Transcript_100767/g.200179  ORF Transcript_100767/g.200179 Transcript_100767/m.200179 type:complete len:229 (-) Transcript_100767:581-1267(-)